MKKGTKEPIRIAQIIGKWVGGGVEAVVMNYYRNIDHKRIQFDFICDDDSTNIPYEEIEKLGGKVILIPPYQKVFKYQRELRKVLKQGNYKIVHSHINTLSVFPLYAAKKVGMPVRIAHSHSTTNKKERMRNILKQILRPLAKLFATHYYACTEHAGRWLFGNRSFDNGKVYVMNNAIDLDKFKYDKKIRDKKRKELGISDDTLVVGHIGRFMKQKNHTFLIDIFKDIHKKNENSILVLVGQGPLQEEIRAKVRELGLDKVVKFLGQRDDVNELYQALDAFILPSLYEGLGLVLIEAECAGVPCVASEEVPLIAKVTDNLEFVSLDDSVQVWSDTTFKLLNNYKRKDYSKEVRNSGYDIKEEAKKLEKNYLEYQGDNNER